MKTFALFSAVSVAFAVATTPAFAIGGSSAGTDPSKPTPKVVQPKHPSAKTANCKRGYTAKRGVKNGKKRWLCTKLKVGALEDFELYQQARLLADQGEYEWALDHLRLISNQNDPEVLNYTGYANRKAGRLETGIGYYQQALAINANYVQAREYLGEAYVLAGFSTLATEQLIEIEKRAGRNSEAFVALQQFMKTHALKLPEETL
jgi:tetratricopeptide (TPR) repeat protein